MARRQSAICCQESTSPRISPSLAPKFAVVVNKDREAGFGKSLREALEPVLLHSCVAVRHRDGRPWLVAFGGEEPASQAHTTLGCKFNISFCNHARFLRLALTEALADA
jgi:hypothetical protein